MMADNETTPSAQLFPACRIVSLNARIDAGHNPLPPLPPLCACDHHYLLPKCPCDFYRNRCLSQPTCTADCGCDAYCTCDPTCPCLNHCDHCYCHNKVGPLDAVAPQACPAHARTFFRLAEAE